MVLEARGSRSWRPSFRCPSRGRARCCSRCPVVRRLPHRPARRRRRAPRAEAAARARPPDRGPGDGARRGRRALRARRPGRRAVARLDRRHLPLLHERAREPLRRAPASPATSSTAATPSTRSPTSASASRSPRAIPDLQAAPLLCAGLIGYRSLRMAGRRRAPRPLRLRRRGAHRRPGRAPPGPARLRLHPRATTRRPRASRLELGAEWAGRLDAAPPRRSSTPRSSSRRSARWCRPRCARSAKGGTVVCAGIHMSDIPSFPYEILWGERVLRSVANLTRAGRRGVPAARAAGAGAHRGGAVPARAGERGARPPARRARSAAPRCYESRTLGGPAVAQAPLGGRAPLRPAEALERRRPPPCTRRGDGHAAVAGAHLDALGGRDRGRRASPPRRRCASRSRRSRLRPGSPPARSSQKSLAAAAAADRSAVNRPGAPSVPSAPTATTCSATSGCTASGFSCGEPSVTIPDTRSGRRRRSPSRGCRRGSGRRSPPSARGTRRAPPRAPRAG